MHGISSLDRTSGLTGREVCLCQLWQVLQSFSHYCFKNRFVLQDRYDAEPRELVEGQCLFLAGGW